MRSNYDKRPFVAVPGDPGRCVRGWEPTCVRLREAIAARGEGKTVVTVECYAGVFTDEITTELVRGLAPAAVVRSAEALLPEEQVDARVAPFNGGDDPVFGRLSDLDMVDFFDPGRLEELRRRVRSVDEGVVLVVGTGASLVHPGDVLVYGDLPRWEAQLRMRRSETSNLGTRNHELKWSLQYKRAWFTDWRVCDRLKRTLMPRWDFVLDTCAPDDPRLAEGQAVRDGLAHTVTRPFRVVPFFDPAPWGGQWMKEVCDLDPTEDNYGWCFDCVPEENSLLLGFGETLMELPAIDVVFAEPLALLGEKVHARFGAEFPIRFDFLDTMDGGNLSFQVHPLTEYIRSRFGMMYTQDESYYLLDAGEGASVYLGLEEGIDRDSMVEELHAAQRGEKPFDADRFACRWPARKHDHFMIPAGTCHCSGRNAMVLEISATPYIFTFKLWDWGRMGLDGLPRPIHLEHGENNIRWDRTRRMVERELINRVEEVGRGAGWREERTGLHELEFLETRRHWFSDTVPHDTSGGVNVLNLVEGREAIVGSPDGSFDPFVVHYAETFIVPAAVGRYTIRPRGDADGNTCATIKASVRV